MLLLIACVGVLALTHRYGKVVVLLHYQLTLHIASLP